MSTIYITRHPSKDGVIQLTARAYAGTVTSVAGDFKRAHEVLRDLQPLGYGREVALNEYRGTAAEVVERLKRHGVGQAWWVAPLALLFLAAAFASSLELVYWAITGATDSPFAWVGGLFS